MDFLQALWHLFNLFVPAVGVAALTAALAKLLWRRELAARPWWQLARGAALAGALVLLAGLVITGRDGKMATYAALLGANALALWWLGFR